MVREHSRIAEFLLQATVQERPFLTWQTGNRFHSWHWVPQAGSSVMLGESGANDPNFNLRREPMLIQRVERGRSLLFAGVLESHGYYDPDTERVDQSSSRIAAIRTVRFADADLAVVETSAGARVAIGVQDIGLYAWVPYVGAMLGAWFGGLLAQNRIKAGWTVDRTRKTVITLGGVIMLVSLLLTINASTPLVAVLLMAAILFGFQTAIGNIQTLPSDYYAGSSVGTLAGYAGTAAKLAVVGLNFLIPVITQDSYAPAFVIGAALAILTVLSVFLLCRDIKPLQPKAG